MAEKPEDIKQDEQNLKEYLQGDSALSKAYGAEGKQQVPEHLDKIILSAANEAVRSKPQSNVAYSPFARTWYVPASMAAVLMLSVGLVFTIYNDSGQTLLTAPKSEFDIDARIVPVESVKSIGQSEAESVGEKKRKDKYEILDLMKSLNALYDVYHVYTRGGSHIASPNDNIKNEIKAITILKTWIKLYNNLGQLLEFKNKLVKRRPG